MKKIKLLTPLMGLTAIAGTIIPLASCSCNNGNTGDIVIEGDKDKKSENTVNEYTCVLNQVPEDKKCKVKITNSDQNAHKVTLVDEVSNGDEATYTVGSDKKVSVIVKLANAPVVDCKSTFSLQFTSTMNGQTVTSTINDCVYEYKVADKYVDIGTSYTPSITPKTSWASRFTWTNEYITEMLNNKDVFRQDFYYTITNRFKKCKDSGQFSSDATLSVYVNDLWKENDGFHCRINYKLKASSMEYGSWKLKNIDCVFTAETPTGYLIELTEDADSNGAWQIKVVAQESLRMIGWFNGKYTVQTTQGEQTCNWNNTIDTSKEDMGQDEELASRFVQMCMGWCFDWGSSNYGYFYSYYSKNFAYTEPLGYVTINGEKVAFKTWKESKLADYNKGNIVLGGKQYTRTEFNYPIELVENLTKTPENFLCGCTKFNSKITLPSSIKTIEYSFLDSCESFNQPIELPSNLTKINSNFLYDCKTFNKQFNIPSSVTELGSFFLGGCEAFNQPIVLPSNLTTIGESFLYICKAFNQPIELPSNLTEIDNYFMCECTAFAQNLTIPKSVTYIGWSFLRILGENMNNKTITINCSADVFSSLTSSSFTSTKSGVTLKIAGPYADKIIEKFGPLSGPTYYRNLVKA